MEPERIVKGNEKKKEKGKKVLDIEEGLAQACRRILTGFLA